MVKYRAMADEFASMREEVARLCAARGEPPPPTFRLPIEFHRPGEVAVVCRVAGEAAAASLTSVRGPFATCRFLYVLEAHRSEGLPRTLVGRTLGLVRSAAPKLPVLATFEWLRGEPPPGIASALEQAGFVRRDQAVLWRRLAAPFPERAPPPGYVLKPLADEHIEQAAQVMLAAPEPGAFAWTLDTCRVALERAAEPETPRFPAGRAQGLFAADGTLAAFAAADATGFVQLVFAHPAHRGRGLASAALGAVLRALREEGREETGISVVASNEAAATLYSSLGFEERRRYAQFFLEGPFS